MRLVRIYEQTPEQVFEHNPDPQNSPVLPKKAPNNSKISSKFRLRIERNIENRNCHSSLVDCDDDNEEEEEEKDEKEQEEKEDGEEEEEEAEEQEEEEDEEKVEEE